MKTKSPNLQIGVMGSAFNYSNKAIIAGYKAGKAIAENNCTLVTGATTGVPYAAVLGAKESNGTVIGISPANDANEHINKYKKPLDGFDAIVYTGMGYNGREPINIKTCDGIIYIAGEFGTLIEFGQGFYDGKVLGVVIGIGGITDKIKEIVKLMKSSYGSEIIYDTDPKRLVKSVIKSVENKRNSARHLHKKTTLLGQDVKNILLKY